MIGILGGTFDPIHAGHLAIAEAAQQAFDLSQVYFIPCYLPPHRATPCVSAKQRLEMVRLATAPYTNFLVDDREIKRQGLSYMIDTLSSLQQEHPDTPLALILGYDAWAGFPSWHRAGDILAQYQLILVNRPGYALSHPALLTAHREKIHLLTTPMHDLSATALRNQLKARQNKLNDLLPDGVFAYICQHQLYLDKKNEK